MRIYSDLVDKKHWFDKKGNFFFSLDHEKNNNKGKRSQLRDLRQVYVIILYIINIRKKVLKKYHPRYNYGKKIQVKRIQITVKYKTIKGITSSEKAEAGLFKKPTK